MADTANLRLVRRYFDEVIDGRTSDLSELFTDACRIHRWELPEPIVGREAYDRFLAVSRATIRETETTIDALIGDGDQVVARLSHRVTFAGPLFTPFGLVEAAGRTVGWRAMAWFHLVDGRIDELWVGRDEVAVFRQLDLLPKR